MTKQKKRPSKNAKAASKILEESKLLATSKTVADANADQIFKPNQTLPKTAAANKMRPDKKRG